MSGNSGNLKRGGYANHHKDIKIVKDWHFISDQSGYHNSDIIVVSFEDGTTTESEGWSYLRVLTKREMREVEINDLLD